MPEMITSLKEASAVADEWRGLVASDRRSSYFMTPDWTLSWAQHFAVEDVAVACWRDATGRLEAVVGLSIVRQTIHQLLPVRIGLTSNLGGGPGAADHNGWVVAPHLVDDVRDWLVDFAGKRPILLYDMDPGCSDLVPEGSIHIGDSACPRVEIPIDPDQIGSSTKFQKQLRYYRRRLESEGVTFSWVPPESTEGSHLALAIEMHARRRSLKGDQTTFTYARLPFHEALRREAAPGRGPALVVAYRSGTPIGMVYGFLWKDTFSFYQSGWDPEWAEMSLGTVMVAEGMRMVRESGVRVWDFLRGPERYKYRFGASDRTDATWLMPNGLAGRALQMKHRVKAARSTEPG